MEVKMGLIKTGVYLGLFAASMTASGVTGGYLGYQAGQDAEFTIQRTNNIPSLVAHQLDKSYAISTIDNDVFLGGLDHQVKGVKAMAQQEAHTPKPESSLQDVLDSFPGFQSVKNGVNNIKERLR